MPWGPGATTVFGPTEKFDTNNQQKTTLNDNDKNKSDAATATASTENMTAPPTPCCSIL